MARVATLDIEVYDTTDEWVQAKYLVHGYDDVFWTDDIDAAMQFLEQSMKIAEGDIFLRVHNRAIDRKRHLHSLCTKKNCNAIASGENSATRTLHDKLVELSDLYKQGVLTEWEYGAAKEKVLGL